MLVNTVQQPSREVRRLAVRIDFAMSRFLKARGNDAVGSKWESDRHAWTLSNLSLRHAEAVCVLARTDEVLLPAAWATARSAMESAARSLWLLEPKDSWEREARWLALVYEGARLDDRIEVSQLYGGGQLAPGAKQFADAVSAMLPSGVTVPGVPGIKYMLEPHGAALVGLYAVASQYTHAADLAARQWRTNLGVDAAYGEFVTSSAWLMPLWVGWQAFRATALTLMGATGTEALDAALLLIDRQVNEARDELARSVESSE
jgi:hypothetical protein